MQMITCQYSLLLLVGVLMFCGLVGRRSLGRMCHCGEVVSHWDASRDNPFHGCRKSSWSHTTMPGGYLYVAPLSSGWIACWSITDQGADVMKNSLLTQFLNLSGMWPVIARRISVAAASLILREACSLHQAVWGVQMRFGVSFNGPWAKLRAQIHAHQGQPLISCLLWGPGLRLSHPPGHLGQHSLEMLLASSAL